VRVLDHDYSIIHVQGRICGRSVDHGWMAFIRCPPIISQRQGCCSLTGTYKPSLWTFTITINLPWSARITSIQYICTEYSTSALLFNLS
jgi:hypothetical protein